MRRAGSAFAAASRLRNATSINTAVRRRWPVDYAYTQTRVPSGHGSTIPSFVRIQATSFSTATSMPGVNAHKPVPSKLRRKLSKRQKKKDPKLSSPVSPKAHGQTLKSSTNKQSNESKKVAEEAMLAASAARDGSSKDSIEALEKPEITEKQGPKDTAGISRSEEEEASGALSKVEVSSAAVEETVGSSDVQKPSQNSKKSKKKKKAKLKQSASTEHQVGQMVASISKTLEEIKLLQKTLPNVSEVAQLLENLRKDSFNEGHTLFDMYRNYGNPFLDENFLTPGVIACCEAKKPAEGIRIVRDMLDQGRKVDESTFRALFTVCDVTKSGKEVIELWDLMQRAGMKLELKEYNKMLDICHESSYLDGAVKVLKQIRLLRDVSVNTYMYWLARAARVWRADAFLDLLMEMRLSGVEPEVLSLTSLESGRKDKALTVMEGVRAVGLDPCFAMSSVYSSMQLALYNNGPAVTPITGSAIQEAKAKFGDLKPYQIDWPVKPVPQVLETQAAGLILQQETFRRLKLHQVHRIDELLQMLPITANLTLNLRKQLQRMMLIVNTQRMRLMMSDINDEYTKGKSLIDIGKEHHYPPVSVMRIILTARGFNALSIKRALNKPEEYLSKRDQHELRKAVQYDSIHKSDPFISRHPFNSDELEQMVVDFIKAKGIRVKTEEELGQEQVEKYGRRVISPDILLLDPVIINGTPVRWIDAKNYYGAHIVGKDIISKQLEAYVREWGPGAIVFGMGFSDMFSIPGVVCLDATPLPKTASENLKMRSKSILYSMLSPFRWKRHLGSDLQHDYPSAPSANRADQVPAQDQTEASDSVTQTQPQRDLNVDK